MPGPEKQMKFQHSYIDKDKMKGINSNTLSNDFKSYLGNGTAGITDKIHGGLSREKVMENIRNGLAEQMREINSESEKDAKHLQEEHKNLRTSMEEALTRAREATRQKKLLQARLAMEKSNFSKADAMYAENELRGFVETEEKNMEKDPAMNAVKNAGVGRIIMPGANQNAQQNNTTDTKTWTQDYQTILSYKTAAEQKSRQDSGFLGIFGSIGKKIELLSIEKQIDAQDKIEEKQKNVLRDKANAWNQKRKSDYESGSFRKHYDAFDKAAASYRELNRKGGSALSVPVKDVKEYVGEFDIDKLNDTLEELPANPYLTTGIAIKNKKENGGISETDLIKSHSKMTFVSLEDENGVRTRYKFDNNFKGYTAARQFDEAGSTALGHRQEFVDRKKKIDSFEDENHFNLEIDEKFVDKDGNYQYVNSEENLKIIQAKTHFLRTGKKVNGVFLNGEFLSADRKIIKGKKDGYTIGAFNTWGYTKDEEDARRAVLTVSIFHLLNSRTIQYLSGYEAEQQTGAKKILENVRKDIDDARKDKKLDGEFDEWKATILGGNEEEINKLPDAVKLQVAHEVLKSEVKANSDNIKDIGDEKTNMGKAFKAISNDPQAVIDLSLLLLSDDTHGEYWDLAREICTEHMPYKFKLSTTTQKHKDQFVRAVEYARTKKGQVMRMALIDELKAERKNFDYSDIFASFMPTKFKQYVEDKEGERGYGAILKRKALDGTMLKFVGDMFDTFASTNKNMKLTGDNTIDNINMVNYYVKALTSAVDTSGLTQMAAMLPGDLYYGKEKEANGTYIDKTTGEEKEKLDYSAELYRNKVGTIFNVIKSCCKMAKAITKFIKKKQADDELKKKQEPNYNPQSITETKEYELLMSVLGICANAGAFMSKQLGEIKVSSICGVIKDTIAAAGSMISSVQAKYQAIGIEETEKEFDTLMTKSESELTKDDKEMIDVLKNNSQLQYGLSLASRKSRDEQDQMALQAVKSTGKVALGVFKTCVGGDTPVGKVFPPFAIVDGAWTAITTIAEIGQEMDQHRQNVNFNIEKMLGKKFKGINKKVLNKVLRREAGITSVDYLPDLARIFMGINTHVFMQEANTKAEKKIAAKIARTILHNKNFNEDTVKNVKSKHLLTAMGVKGNFHKILKHSLA